MLRIYARARTIIDALTARTASSSSGQPKRSLFVCYLPGPRRGVQGGEQVPNLTLSRYGPETEFLPKQCN